MKQYLTPHSIANTIRLKSSRFKGVFLLVEGPDDVRFFNMFTDSAHCKVEAAFGKQNVYEAHDILLQSDFNRLVAIVDADYDTILDRMPQKPALFGTDTHDIETLIMKSPALDKVLAEYAHPDRVQKFLKGRKETIQELILKAGTVIGYVRCVSQKRHLRLKLSNNNMRQFIDLDTFTIDLDGLVNHITRYIFHDENIDEKEFIREIKELINRQPDPWLMARGHDMTFLLSMSLQIFGYNRHREISADHLESSLRLAYSHSFFRETQLYKDVKKYAATHHWQIFE